jgi:hypothetical protein
MNYLLTIPVVLAFLFTGQFTTLPAQQSTEVTTIHQEPVTVGPYRLSVGFSRWPMQADRSLDILFIPEGGIEELRGSVTLVSPTGVEETIPLSRHPRMRSVWGLDVIALPEAGPWSLVFRIDGPLGPGEGRLAPLMLGARPGPDLALSWMVGLLPAIGLLILLIVAWLRVRPNTHPETWRWQRAG